MCAHCAVCAHGLVHVRLPSHVPISTNTNTNSNSAPFPIPGCGGNRDCPLGMVKVKPFPFPLSGVSQWETTFTEIQGEWYIASLCSRTTTSSTSTTSTTNSTATRIPKLASKLEYGRNPTRVPCSLILVSQNYQPELPPT
eukprot:3114780-Rhodomonas_salina.1